MIQYKVINPLMTLYWKYAPNSRVKAVLSAHNKKKKKVNQYLKAHFQKPVTKAHHLWPFFNWIYKKC